MAHHLRVARPVSDLARSSGLYCRGLGLRVIDHFEDHAGFDGVMLGTAGAGYHLELTHSRQRPVTPSPTPEDLLVFYVPDEIEWEAACRRMEHAGFRPVAPFNPYWAASGRTFEDPDGYRIVLQRESWPGK